MTVFGLKKLVMEDLEWNVFFTRAKIEVASDLILELVPPGVLPAEAKKSKEGD